MGLKKMGWALVCVMVVGCAGPTQEEQEQAALMEFQTYQTAITDAMAETGLKRAECFSLRLQSDVPAALACVDQEAVLWSTTFEKVITPFNEFIVDNPHKEFLAAADGWEDTLRHTELLADAHKLAIEDREAWARLIAQVSNE